MYRPLVKFARPCQRSRMTSASHVEQDRVHGSFTPRGDDEGKRVDGLKEEGRSLLALALVGAILDLRMIDGYVSSYSLKRRLASTSNKHVCD